MKIVTLLLSGLPRGHPRYTLQYLAQYLDIVFDKEDIGTFRLREANNKIAVDFNTGYDAMHAQYLLDGKSYTIDNGNVTRMLAFFWLNTLALPFSVAMPPACWARYLLVVGSSIWINYGPSLVCEVRTLRARVTHDPALVGEQPLPLVAYRPVSLDPSSSDEDRHLSKAEKKICKKLSYLEIKKRAIMSEEKELYVQRLKIRRELRELDSDEGDEVKKIKKNKNIPKKQKRKASSSSSSESDSSESDKAKRKRYSKDCSPKRGHTPKTEKSNGSKRRSRHSRGKSQNSESESEKAKRKRSLKDKSQQGSHTPNLTPKTKISNDSKRRSRHTRDTSQDSRQSTREKESKSRDVSKKSLSHDRMNRSREKSSDRQRSPDSEESPREMKRRHDRKRRSRDSRERSCDSRERSFDRARRSRDSRERSYDRARRSRSRESSRTNRSPSYMRASTSRNENVSWRRREYRSRSREDRYRPRDSLRERRRTRESHERPVLRSIEYKPKTPEQDNLRVESVIVKKEIDPDKIELDAKIKIAIKEILIDLETRSNKLSVQYNASSESRKKVLKKMFQIVHKRFKQIEVNNTMSAANLVVLYRCEWSKVEDEDRLFDIFMDVMATEESETSSTQPKMDLPNNLEEMLEELDVDELMEDIKPKIEPEDDDDDEEEGEIADFKIRINVIPATRQENKPASTASHVIETTVIENDKRKKNQPPQLYVMYDRGYHVEITVYKSRKNIFIIPIKKLLRQMRFEIKKYTEHIEIELFQYVLKIKLEKQIKELLEGIKEKIKATRIIELYREKYPIERDEEFVLEMLCAVWRGEYNDSERKAEIEEEMNRNNIRRPRKPRDVTVRIKQEKDAEKRSENDTQELVKVKSEPQNDPTDDIVGKTVEVKKELEKDITDEQINDLINDIPKISEVIKMELNTDVKTEGNVDKNTTTQDDEIVVLEPKAEVIDLSDNDVKTEGNIDKNTTTQDDEIVVLEPKAEVIDLSDNDVEELVKKDPDLGIVKQEVRPMIDPAMQIKMELMDDVIDISTDDEGLNDTKRSVPLAPQHNVQITVAATKPSRRRRRGNNTGDKQIVKQNMTDSVIISDDEETLESIQEFMNQFI